MKPHFQMHRGRWYCRDSDAHADAASLLVAYSIWLTLKKLAHDSDVYAFKLRGGKPATEKNIVLRGAGL